MVASPPAYIVPTASSKHVSFSQAPEGSVVTFHAGVTSSDPHPFPRAHLQYCLTPVFPSEVQRCHL